MAITLTKRRNGHGHIIEGYSHGGWPAPPPLLTTADLNSADVARWYWMDENCDDYAYEHALEGQPRRYHYRFWFADETTATLYRLTFP